jgi:hypothetical protein
MFATNGQNISGLLPGPNRPSAVEAVEGEILQEKAEALGRTGERLGDALKALEAARVAIGGIEARLRDGTGSAEEAALLQEAREKLAARLPLLRDRSDRAFHYLVIQREAVRARDHRDIERSYKIPERLRLR